MYLSSGIPFRGPPFKLTVYAEACSSVRTSQHVIDAALIGAHIATLPPKVIKNLYNHELTDKGLKAFLDDWAKTDQSILPK